MKHNAKIFAATLAAALVLSGALFAQGLTSVPPIAFPAATQAITLGGFQGNPESVEFNMTYGRMTNAIDNYIAVNYWGTVGIDNFFAFAGGTGAGNVADLKLGFAKKLGDNLLGVYFSGNLLSGNGDHTELNADEFVTIHTTNLERNNLAVLFGTPSIGAFRVDVLFNNTSFGSSKSENLTAGDSKTTSNTPFITTLQWGMNIPVGDMILRPAVTVGYKWHSHEKTETKVGNVETVEEIWGDASAALPWANGGSSIEDGAIYGKIAVPIKFENWTISPDYAIELGLAAKSKVETKTPTTTTTTEKQRSGAVWHEINLAASRTWKFTDQLSLGFKPNIKVKLYSWSNKFTETSETTVGAFNSKNETETQTGAFSAFQLTPVINLGLKYQWKPTLALYTGLGITVFDYQYLGKKAGKDWTEAESRYSLTALTPVGRGQSGSLGLGLTIEPADGFGIEIGLTSEIISLSNFNIDINSFSGVLAVRYAM
jgi:hypothetical protein